MMEYFRKLNEKFKKIKHDVEMTTTGSKIWDRMFDLFEETYIHLEMITTCNEEFDKAAKDILDKETLEKIYNHMLDYTRQRIEKDLNFSIPDEVHEQFKNDIDEEFNK